ncbi:unnamed protein product [Ambrosiozyma monospora]|uniref:Unnamed protein product n=1 Tax=Ambrosiozyma monospora TaxID=43982 RepID=A0A9W6Z1Q6_AMBMO|nr:unnamed protein product [Ambrosiozyma monospora]
MVQSTLPFLISPDKTPKRQLDQTDKENQQHGSSLKKQKVTKIFPAADATADNNNNRKDNPLGTPPNEPFPKQSNETAQEVILLDSPEKPKPVETLLAETSNTGRISIKETTITNSENATNISKDELSSGIDDSFTKDDSILESAHSQINKLSKEEKEKLKAEKKLQKQKENEERLLKKQKEQEERLLKKRREQEERQLKKKKEEEERRIKKEKLEAERQLKREQKEKEKLEKQQKREEEARQKEEERQKKKAEAEEKKKRQEEDKQKLKKQEELKKEKRAITNFFRVVKTPVKSSGISSTADPVVNGSPKSKSSTGSPLAHSKSVYSSTFLPFYATPATRIITHKNKYPDLSVNLQDLVDGKDTSSMLSCIPDFETFLQADNNPSKGQHENFLSAYDVIQKLNVGMSKEAKVGFQALELKYLEFYENKKMPYLGTFSRLEYKETKAACVDPFTRLQSDTLNIEYEYDSDLEEDSDDEGEGDDLEKDDDDEDDEDTEETSDIDEFVETDEVGDGNMKKRIIGTLVPVTRWLDEENATDDFAKYFDSLQYERLSNKIVYPIDPFHNYWESQKSSQSPLKGKHNALTKNAILNSTNSNVNVSLDNTISTTSGKHVAPSEASMVVKKKVITDVDDAKKLTDFITKNNEFTINTMTEVAQKQILSKYSKAVVKNSIRNMASFDKKKNQWVIKTSA